MQRAWSTIPHAWVQEEIDITDIEAGRLRHKPKALQDDITLTMTAILCKALANTLKSFPKFNAAIDTKSKELITRDYTHVGVAVDTERGLVVPAIRDVNCKSVFQIARDLGDISKRARSNKLKADDLQGAGFTLSNLGGIGASGLLPMVNWPEVAILGVASSKQQAVIKNDNIVIRLIMPVTLGFDHRVINGADAARFLAHFKSQLEDALLFAMSI
jgi:pyruvate dehydrogenase E2 component (dihydrolipoamide acetyltransferase)